MSAPPGFIGRVTPNPSAWSASDDTTAIAGISSLSAAAVSPTVAENNTSCPNPRSVCASPSSRATSTPTRITFATKGFPSIRLALTNLESLREHRPIRSQSVAGRYAHIAPRSCLSEKKLHHAAYSNLNSSEKVFFFALNQTEKQLLDQ